MQWKNLSKKWKWTIGIVAVLLVILILGRVKHNGGSVSAPKNVSFVKQAKGSGTHVWFMTTGQAKDSDVYYIVVLKGGKSRTYRVYDSDTTLGKVSKMSDKEAISFAKKQDKKYFEAYGKEVKLAANNEDHSGFNNDVPGLSMPQYSTLVQGGKKVVGTAIATGERSQSNDNPYYVMFNTDGKMTTSSKGTAKRTAEDVTMDEHTLPTSSNSSNDENSSKNDNLLKRLYIGLGDNVEGFSYKAPKAVAVKAKSKTDDSGNTIISQEATIQYNDNMDASYSDNLSQIQENFLEIAKKDPAMMKRLAALDQKNLDARQSNDAEYFDAVQKADREYNQGIDKLMTKKFCKQLTADIFGDYTTDYTMTLKETTSFDIYDSRFIGYNRGGKNGYLVTKAQNDQQTAVFDK